MSVDSDPLESAFYLTFKDGALPDRMSLSRVIAQQPEIVISHDPSDKPDLRVVESEVHGRSPRSPHMWIEILSQGLTYDLEGFLPGRPCPVPVVDHRFDATSASPIASLEGLRIGPSANILGGASTLPVMRGMTSVICALKREFPDMNAIIWPPARSAMGPNYFESVATAWLDGGAFPAIGLTAFTVTAKGEVESVGLSHWTGQELRIETSASSNKADATRLAVRLIDQLVIVGTVNNRLQFAGPDGSPLIVEPSRDRRLLCVKKI